MSKHPVLSPAGRIYVRAVTVVGFAIVALCAYDLVTGRIDTNWLVLAGLTVLSASLTIRVPGVPATISVSETFVFTSLLLFGTSAAALTVAIDGFVASLWIHRRVKYEVYKTLFNVGAPAAAIWIAAMVLSGLTKIPAVVQQSPPIEQVLPPLFLLTALYFTFNSWLTAGAIGFETRVSPMTVWRKNFFWVAINYFGGASVAVLILLLINTPVFQFGTLGIVVPLLTVIYLMFKIAMGRVEDTLAHLTEIKRVGEERSKLEDQLREAQKMESVGRLAAGVAHDLNNLLAPILGYSDMLLDDMPGSSPDREGLLQIRHAAERARDLTRQLLAFGRKQVLTLTPVDLRSVILGFEKFLRRTVREDIKIEVRLQGTPGLVRADTGQIEQVLMNLAVNAQDAMPDGGVLTMELAEVGLDGTMVPAWPGALPGRYVALSVSDTGLGMDRTTLAQACEPFFTTKERGKGTGLGLSTVYGIVKQHGGHLKIDSVLGQGSTFTVYLPRTDETGGVAGSPSGDGSAVPRGTEHILVAEDNDAVRRTARQVLERQGYRVTDADCGEACLDIARNATGRFDMLLTDIVMADMNGRTLYTRLVESVPGLKVLYMSGYADDIIANHGVLEDGIEYIQKPFSPQALSRKVRQVLDSGG